MGYFSQQVENIAHLLMQEAVQTEIYPGGLKRMERSARRLGGEETLHRKAEVVVDFSAPYFTEAKKV